MSRDDDFVVIAGEGLGSGDGIAWLDSGSTVSNARMEILSVSPLRFRDTLTGREWGPEDIAESHVSDGVLFARYEAKSGDEVSERSED